LKNFKKFLKRLNKNRYKYNTEMYDETLKNYLKNQKSNLLNSR